MFPVFGKSLKIINGLFLVADFKLAKSKIDKYPPLFWQPQRLGHEILVVYNMFAVSTKYLTFLSAGFIPHYLGRFK